MRKASKSHDTIQKQVEPVTPEKIGPIHPDQHGGDWLPEDVPIEDESNDPLDDVNQPDYNTGPDPDDDDDDDEEESKGTMHWPDKTGFLEW